MVKDGSNNKRQEEIRSRTGGTLWGTVVRGPQDLDKVKGKEGNELDNATAFVGPDVSFHECSDLEEKVDFIVKLGGNEDIPKNPGHWNHLVLEPLPMIANGVANGHVNGKGHKSFSEPIAVVGLSCRLPGASSPTEFWSNLLNEVDSMSCAPPGRWTKEHGCYVTPAHQKTLAGFLSCPIGTFDTSFFPISPAELAYVDPQARMLLQLSWESLEDAGIPPSALRGTNAGIFLGLWRDEYKDLIVSSAPKTAHEELRRYLGCSMGNSAARVAHFLGTTGPSFAVETGCSSSICSIGQAMAALRKGETNVALAGGANLLLKPFVYDSFQGVLSPNGHCKPFQADADGFSRAEGVIVYVLKRLSDALKDGDRIHCLLRGYSSTQEGLSRSVGTPTIEGEKRAITQALDDAGVSPEQVDWVELHGTGTKVGDPIEVQATREAYQVDSRNRPLLITSLKGNIGHTESVSGAASLLKVILSLNDSTIPPQRIRGEINPKLNMSGLLIPTEVYEWAQTKNKARLAGISSFGITGTNAHLIVQEPPPVPKQVQNEYKGPLILPISAKSKQALEALKQRHAEFLKHQKYLNLGNYCFTASEGRNHFLKRTAIIALSKEEMIDSLETSDGYEPEFEECTSKTKLCFLFPGQGCQYNGMGRELYANNSTFRKHFDVVATLLNKHYGIDLKTLLFKGTEVSLYSQLCIFGVEYCLLKTWTSWGLKPDWVLGHSFGEFAASVAAGAISLPTALELLVAMRTKMFATVEAGSMLVLRAGEAETNEYIQEFLKGEDSSSWVDIAALNSSDQTVVSGEPEIIQKFQSFLQTKQLKTIQVNVTHAFHSRALDKICSKFEAEASSLTYSQRFPEIGYISSVFGRILGSEEPLDGIYWRKHMRQRVEFVAAAESVVREGGAHLFLEVGPHPLLSPLVKKNVTDKQVACIPSMRKGCDEVRTMLEAVAQLYAHGIDLQWNKIWTSFGLNLGPRVDIPLYPFQQNEEFWFSPAERENDEIDLDTTTHPILGQRLSIALIGTSVWQNTTKRILSNCEWIKDHKIGNHAVFPAAGYVEMAVAAAKQIKCTDYYQIKDLEVKAALVLQEGENLVLQTVLEEGSGCLSFYSQKKDEDNNAWKLNAKAIVIPVTDEEKRQIETVSVPNGLRVDEEESSLYPRMKLQGYNFGPMFQTLRESGIGAYTLKYNVLSTSEFCLHPVTIDALIQAALLSSLNGVVEGLSLPTKIGSFLIDASTTPGETVKLTKNTSQDGYTLATRNGKVIAAISNLSTVSTTLANFEIIAGLRKNEFVDTLVSLYKEEWIPKGLSAPIFNWEGKDPKDAILNNVTPYSLSSIQRSEFQAIEHYVRLGIVKALASLGLGELKAGQTFKADKQLMTSLGIKAHPYFFKRLLHYAKIAGYVSQISETEYQIIKGLSTSLCQPNIDFEPTGTLDSEWAFSTFYLDKLPSILSGKESVLPSLFPKDESNCKFSANQLYASFTQNTGLLSTLTSTFSIFLHSLPKKMDRPLRILEVGAGTGSASKVLLQHLQDSGQQYNYMFTDISPAFLSMAEEHLGPKYGKNLEFGVFDVEKDPLAQGFQEGSYDLVVALNVLHATRSMVNTVKNIRTLLREDGGYLLIAEQLEPTALVDIVFGHCEGYWRFEDRKKHCLMKKEEWNSVLEQGGYAPSFCIESADIGMGVVVASTGETSKKDSKNWVIIDTGDELIAKLQDASGSKVVEDIEKLEAEHKGFIFIVPRHDGAHCPAFVRPYAQKFLQLSQFLAKNQQAERNLIVVTYGMGIQSYPVLGLSRTLRSECPSVTCKWINLDSTASQESNLNLLKDELLSTKEREQFVSYEKGSRHVSRLLPSSPSVPLLIPHAGSKMQLSLPESRSIRDVEWEALTTKDNFDLINDEVEIQVSHAGLNFKDLFNIMKPTPEFYNASMVGADFTGQITRASSQSRLKVGDFVFGMNLKAEPLPSHIIMSSACVARLPESWNTVEGSTIPTAFLTAYHCLIDTAHLKEGESVLIHTASGAVGLVAIQIALQIGAKVIVTAGSDRKRNFLRNRMGLEHVFNSRDFSSYEQGIKALTTGKGVNVVLNSLTSRGFKEASLSSLDRNGRFIEMSKLNIWTKEQVQALRPDVFYSVVDLSLPLKERQIHLTRKMEEWAQSGWINPLRYTQFHCSFVHQALSYLERAQQIGKVVINMDRSQRLFDDKSSYLITGGTGGIGLKVVKWMLSNGAKNIVICSRSGGKIETIRDQLEDGDTDGLVVKKADISNLDQVKGLLDNIKMEMPPLRGIFHLSGVLSDGILLNQSAAKLESVLKPKVDGAWNLHQASQSLNLDHFVLFSSAMWTLGGPGQGNYAAGNAYLEGLAQLRHSLGLPSTVIHWGHWGQVGMGGEVGRIFGMEPFSTEKGIRTLEYLLMNPTEWNLMAADLNLNDIQTTKWMQAYTCDLMAQMIPSQTPNGQSNSNKDNNSLSVSDSVREVIGRILRVKATTLEGGRELRDIGMDSLMFIELKNKLQQVVGFVIDVQDTATLDDVIAMATRSTT